MLLFSEEYDIRKDDPQFIGNRGLNPELLPEFVRLAKLDGLRTAVHVETEADMLTAIRAGADIIGHLPSYDADIILSDEAISLASSSGLALVTTLSLAKRFESRDPVKYKAILEAQRANLERLSAAGAWLVVGSDNTRGTVTSEVDHLLSLDALSNRELLDMWTWRCSRLAFPERDVGHLIDGYEASFLVLDGNPLEDFAHTAKIRLRVKDGYALILDD